MLSQTQWMAGWNVGQQVSIGSAGHKDMSASACSDWQQCGDARSIGRAHVFV